MIYILYNPLADNRNGGSNAENIGKVLETKDVTYLDTGAEIPSPSVPAIPV